MAAYPGTGEVVSGKYRIVRVLGEGGMGIVLEATNINTGKRVALKWMHPHVSADPVAAERLLREAQVAARVRHPNVIDVYDVERHAEAVFLVMEYLEGEPLRALLGRGDTPIADILAIMISVMHGCSEAHKRGIVHRDIKPENIFLATQGNDPKPVPKLLDFGISKLALQDLHQLPLTKTGATFGTPVYMSYEQLSGRSDLDARTDVYSFGVMLYEALTGRMPYEATSVHAVIIKIATETPVPLREYAPHVPAGLERVVLAALRRDRDKRLPTIDALRTALEPFVFSPTLRRVLAPKVTTMDPTLPRQTFPPASPAAASTFPRRRQHSLSLRMGIAVLACVLIALVAAGITRSTPNAARANSRLPPAAPVLPAAVAPAPQPVVVTPEIVPAPESLPPVAAPVAPRPRAVVAPARPAAAPAPNWDFGVAPARTGKRRIDTPRLDEF
ncbi:MAG TPA: serine/threonine-protein kinase [Polyangiales bacterium]|nr:serine/threonine-protein kinase [Polyangiales bacterium]